MTVHHGLREAAVATTEEKQQQQDKELQQPNSFHGFCPSAHTFFPCLPCPQQRHPWHPQHIGTEQWASIIQDLEQQKELPHPRSPRLLPTPEHYATSSVVGVPDGVDAVALPVSKAALEIAVVVEDPAPQPTLWSCTMVSLRGMLTEAKTADWCAVWAGLLCFLALLPLVLTVTDDDQTKYRVPQPMKWGSDPFEAWDWYNGCFVWLLLQVLLFVYMLCAHLTGKLKKLPVSRYVVGFCALGLLATVCLWLGRNKTLAPFGISYAVYAILLGMIIGNVATLSPRLKAVIEKWLQPVAKDGEFMIKVALVLYAKSFRIIGQVGLPGLIVGWVGSPLAVMVGWFFGTRVLKMENHPQVMLMAVGASWCGASAMAAVQPIVGATSEDLTLSVSIVVLFTLLFQFIQPYLALAMGMPHDVAGAWIGASVDQTGNVVVSAAIMSEAAAEVAGVVKMILNAGLGGVCLVVSLVWSLRDEKGKAVEAGAKPAKKQGSKLWLLWSKFPKFVLGFLFLSFVLTLLEIPLDGTPAGDALPQATGSVSKWWMCIAFLGIGISTDCRKLFNQARRGGAVLLYLVANAVDMALALGLSYLCFGVWKVGT